MTETEKFQPLPMRRRRRIAANLESECSKPYKVAALSRSTARRRTCLTSPWLLPCSSPQADGLADHAARIAIQIPITSAIGDNDNRLAHRIRRANKTRSDRIQLPTFFVAARSARNKCSGAESIFSLTSEPWKLHERRPAVNARKVRC